MRIIITGGGTGGHTSPAVAVIEELQKRDPRLHLLWVGRTGGVEQRISEKLSLPFRGLPVEGWPRRRTPRQLWAGAKLVYSALRSMLIVRKFSPQMVLGVGGYVSLPLVWAAQRLGLPTVLHEQNKRLGMANRILARRATRLFLSYPDTLGNFPPGIARVVGNPVRAGFTKPPSRETARATMGLEPSIPVVLVSGGSQGSRTLNQALTGLVGQLAPGEAQILWMTGASGAADARRVAAESKARVEVFPYIEDMVSACAAADLIISRSGASSTAEIAMLGKPTILVPYPFAADNHQEENARAFEQAEASLILLDSECSPERLLSEMRGLLADKARLAAMGTAAASLARPGAAEHMVEDMFSLVFPTTPAD
ncbi:MAG: undecaprenyldiphospho-muramoylpentapeptide beta-N-acetylglucosaminyltransferase [Candidatus Hydrogenedentes bacterium]|nr:undecaprenyldiphospho-muramoylpentapeptide beta-N-acetylglucosaminyltransferase [Candidatus Hydrogenedentota bacterium]